MMCTQSAQRAFRRGEKRSALHDRCQLPRAAGYQRACADKVTVSPLVLAIAGAPAYRGA
jgi:hypothetical protein